MKSLFLRMFVSFCGGAAVVVFGVVLGYVLTNRDQVPFAWPRVGRGSIVSAGHVAIAAWERGGQHELAPYLSSLYDDTGLRCDLLDAFGRHLAGAPIAGPAPRELDSRPDGQVVVRIREHLAAVRLHGRDGAAYSFVALVPRRSGNLFWSRAFIVAFIIAAALLCYLLARYVTNPVVELRAATSRFSAGDLSARIAAPEVLARSDEIGGLAHDFNHMAARIGFLMQAQQRLIADVSHEFRSPLTRLSLALGLLRRRHESDPSGSLSRMEREVERLNTLIAQLLLLSRLEHLDHAPPMEAVDLAAILREVASDAEFEAAALDRTVHLEPPPPCTILGAPDLIRSALENVVRNAVRYTSANTDVSIRLETASALATIHVADCGPGVPPDAIPHLFEPFYRVDEARDRQSGGAGLGLAIARQVSKLHNGSIGAVNREGGGLEILLTLPIGTPPTAGTAVPAPPPKTRNGGPCRSY